MEKIYALIISNIYLYLCIIIGLIVLTCILSILAANAQKRRKIKNDFIEAEKVEDELNKPEESVMSNKLEEILQKMQEDMNVKPEDVVRKFEEEQEEKAIISYQELVDNVKAGKIEVVDDDDVSDVNYVESLNLNASNEPIMQISEDESLVTPQMVKDAVETINVSAVKEEPKKFKKSEIISPIFGVMEENFEYPKVKKSENILDIMNTRDYNELTEEIKRQEEFLNALKEFRRNL
jgi:hypothetical protein